MYTSLSRFLAVSLALYVLLFLDVAHELPLSSAMPGQHGILYRLLLSPHVGSMSVRKNFDGSSHECLSEINDKGYLETFHTVSAF